MPGSKRRIDEDRWLEKQLKKFKFSQVDANVYASTLAKLRQGARQLFARPREQEQLDPNFDSLNMATSSPNARVQDPPGNNVANSPGSTTSATSADTSEGMQVDILNDGEEMKMDTSFCDDCTRRLSTFPSGTRTPAALLEKCTYCEIEACHLNYCKMCTSGFCATCCIARYDEPTQDTHVCISCLSSAR